jgi:hypothetical protein
MSKSSRAIHPETGVSLRDLRSTIQNAGRYAEYEKLRDKYKRDLEEPECFWAAIAEMEEREPIKVPERILTQIQVARKTGKPLPPPIRARAGIVMLSREDFKSLSAAPEAVLDWVLKNLGIEEAEPADAPCPGAWFMLQQCRNDQKTLDDFLRLTWPKSLPQKMTSETIHVYEDDARKVMKVTREIERIRDESEAETADV